MPKKTKEPVQVLKRDGTSVLFNRQKVTIAICKAMSSVDQLDLAKAEEVTDLVVSELQERSGKKIPHVEVLQDLVEEQLIKAHLVDTAKAYILYRQQRSELREARKAVLQGQVDDIDLSLNALSTLESRYLLRDGQGLLKETPTTLFSRVAKTVAQGCKAYKEDVDEMAQRFERLMVNRQFLPNSPTLMHAGTKKGHLLAQHAIPVGDSIASIYAAARDAALIHAAGGGTGFDLSTLRQKGSPVTDRGNVALGPVAALRVLEAALHPILQGGRREGANMAILRVDHPDIIEFINAKAAGMRLTNFNISVGVTNAFMEAVQKRTMYSINDPVTGESLGKADARVVFDTILSMAWRRGDPGMIFVDRIEEDNVCPHLGTLHTTSPCAEIALLDYESCAQGSINILSFIDDDGIFNWDRFKSVIHDSVVFLDTMLDVTHYPVEAVREATLRTRKIGLGIMGFADLLYKLKIRYGSKSSKVWADKIISFLRQESEHMSQILAERRGVFPEWKKSTLALEKKVLRNANLLAISPTGSRSMIFDVSSGIEPNFALAYTKRALGGKEFTYVNEVLKDYAEQKDMFNDTFVREVSLSGLSNQDIDATAKRVFVTTQNISAQDHIDMQAIFQKGTDGSISKTINFPASATVLDVEEGFLRAYKAGCKGVTIYRDGSLDGQVLTVLK